jgi:VCBS repeat protein
MVAGKFFRSAGGLRFADQTRRRGLAALNWTVGRWARFFDVQINEPAPIQQLACAQSNRKPICRNMKQADHQAYGSTVAWGDFDNDGCVDFVFADRHEDPTNLDGLRNVLFRNRCDGTFEPVRTQLSGLDTNSVSVEVADLDGDGLLDLVAGAQPTNTYPLSNPPLPDDRYYDKVFLNTGAWDARANHFLEIDLAGKPQRRLIGTQLLLTGLRKGGGKRFLGRRDYVTSDSYKSGRWPRVHWGLGKLKRARIHLRLPDGRRLRVRPKCVDRRLTVNVRTGRVTGCRR